MSEEIQICEKGMTGGLGLDQNSLHSYSPVSANNEIPNAFLTENDQQIVEVGVHFH